MIPKEHLKEYLDVLWSAINAGHPAPFVFAEKKTRHLQVKAA
jgi:hypothetical protein